MFPMHNTEMRIAMMQAADEARTHGHGPIGTDHLLLGILSNLRGRGQQLLAEHGVTYAEARERVLADRGTGSTETPATPTVEDDREALGAIGIDLDRVREAVLDNFGEDITEDWGERGGRGRRGPQGRGEGPGRGPRGHGRGRGRRGPGSGRFGADVDESVHELLGNLRSSMWPDGHPGRGRRDGDRPRRGERPSRDERPGREEMRALRRTMSEGMPDRLLLEILRLDEPHVATVLGDADRDAMIRELETRVEAPAATA